MRELSVRETGQTVRKLFSAVSSGETTKVRQITQHHGNDPRVMNYVTADTQATALMYAAKNGLFSYRKMTAPW